MMPPTLATPRCRLRPFEERDLAAFARYRDDPRVSAYQSWDRYDDADARAFYVEQLATRFGAIGTWTQLAIERVDDGALLGDVALHFMDPEQIELGFTLAHASQGAGFAREAVGAVLAYGFETLGRHRVIATTDTRNAAAIRLLGALGFRREAHYVKNVFFKGAWGDEYVFALLQTEWRDRLAGR